MFWDRFKMLCEKRGMSPNGVAKTLGFSSAIVTYWSRGTNPSTDKLEKIADFFDVSIEYLTGRADIADDTRKTGDSEEARALIDDIDLLHKNPELRVLLSASSKLTKDDIAAITEIAIRMNRERDDG